MEEERIYLIFPTEEEFKSLKLDNHNYEEAREIWNKKTGRYLMGASRMFGEGVLYNRLVKFSIKKTAHHISKANNFDEEDTVVLEKALSSSPLIEDRMYGPLLVRSDGKMFYFKSSSKRDYIKSDVAWIENGELEWNSSSAFVYPVNEKSADYISCCMFFKYIVDVSIWPRGELGSLVKFLSREHDSYERLIRDADFIIREMFWGALFGRNTEQRDIYSEQFGFEMHETVGFRINYIYRIYRTMIEDVIHGSIVKEDEKDKAIDIILKSLRTNYVDITENGLIDLAQLVLSLKETPEEKNEALDVFRSELSMGLEAGRPYRLIEDGESPSELYTILGGGSHDQTKRDKFLSKRIRDLTRFHIYYIQNYN